jgi:glyoxylase-like metal-dependent hydrolase (beta-lactamase superfamily II)
LSDISDFKPLYGVAEEITPGLRRIVAPNPSPMTFHGTNTYILGTGELAVIDPGPISDPHLQAILNSVGVEQKITHIIVTHSHIDHSPLALSLSKITDAPVLAFGNSEAGKSEIMSKLKGLGGGEGVDVNFSPDSLIKDTDIIKANDWELQAFHTPGHMGNHLCLYWSNNKALFSGDLVMGWATSLVSPPDGDLTDFMSSLKKLMLRFHDEIYYPGHGAPILNPRERLLELYNHRKNREAQILSILGGSSSTINTITKIIYGDIDRKLIGAAKRNVLAHIIDLTNREVCKPEGPFDSKAAFKLN